MLKRYNRNVFFIQKDNFVFYWLILTGFCVFDKSSGDYFHYLDIVQDLSQSRFLESHLEDFYIELIKIIKGNYFLFRIIVWGGAVINVFLIIRRLEINRNIAYILFMLYALLFFSYTRAFLGVSFFFLGYTFLIKPNKKYRIYSICLGFLIILCSLFLHKSIVMLCVLLPFSFFEMTKKKCLCLLLLFPIVIYNIDKFIAILFTSIEIRGGSYLLAEKTSSGSIGGDIYFFFYILSIFFLLIRIFNILSISKRKNIPFSIRRIYSFSICIFYASFLLSFLSFGHAAVSYRLRNMGFIPLAFVISYFVIYEEIKYKYLVVSLFLILIADNCYLGYMYYLKSVLGL